MANPDNFIASNLSDYERGVRVGRTEQSARIAELERVLAKRVEDYDDLAETHGALKTERDAVRKALEKLADSLELGSGSPYITGVDEHMLKATAERIRALLAAAREGAK